MSIYKTKVVEDGNKISIEAWVEKPQKIGDLPPGSFTKIGDQEFIILSQAKKATTVITKDPVVKMQYGETSDYKTSLIRKYCMEEFYPNLIKHMKDSDLLTRKRQMELSYNNFIQDKVFIMSREQYRHCFQYLPKWIGVWLYINNKWDPTGVMQIDATHKPYYSRCFDYGARVTKTLGVCPMCRINPKMIVNFAGWNFKSEKLF